jgi:hypothetical protein
MKTIKKIRSKLLEFLTHKIALPLIVKFRDNDPFRYSMSDLEGFPEGTLGKDLVEYLKKKNFKLLRNYERHDCKHIILGYEMDEVGEARMQFYFLGNRHYSVPVISTVIICFVLMPEHWSSFFEEYKKGKSGKSFDDLNYNDLVLLNTADLQHAFRPMY